LKGIKWVDNAGDRIVVTDPKGGPIWARFYEIGSNRPIFVGRDGVVKYSVAEIEHERRTGYNWYVNAPAQLIRTDYPAWRERYFSRKGAKSQR
jgi:PelA/Pel-15E family pectate lyase